MRISRASLRTLPFRVAADRRGATAIEYGLIVALIVIAMMVAFIEVANRTTGLWTMIGAKVVNAQ